MAIVQYQDLTFTLQDNQSLLDGLKKQGQIIPNSCRSGVCQSCMMQAVTGSPPTDSQQGLKQTLVQQKYFLACKCFPEEDIKVALPTDSAVSMTAQVIEKTPLTDDVLALKLKTTEPFTCMPGQYINLVKDNLIRSYSVANLCDVDGYLELHIKRMPKGQMSNYLHDTLAINEQIKLRGPTGSCFYSPGDDKNYPLLLAGTGTGLAPLEGIVKDALHQDHSGEITLIHGAANESGIYHAEELSDLASTNPSFTYKQSRQNDNNPEANDLIAMVNKTLETLDLTQVRVYLCGAPALVNKLKTQVFLKGVSSANIYTDPFITADITS